MATFARVVMRALMMLTTLLIATGAFLGAQTPFQHVTVALVILLFCAIRFVGLTVLEELRADHKKSRLRTTFECGLLTILAFYAALKILTPSLLVGWP